MMWVMGNGRRARTREASGPPARTMVPRVACPVAGVVVAALAVAGCGTVRAGAHGRTGDGWAGGCVTTVRGAVRGAGSLAAGWVPAGFRPSGGSQPGSALPSLSYQLGTGRPNPPRLSVTVSYDRGRLTHFVGGWSTSVRVTVQGHPGLLESGPPAPQGAGVFWKPSGTFLLSVTGDKLPGAVVLRVARQVSFQPPGVVWLPLAAGRIVTRQQAVANARRSAHLPAAAAAAKLSSWTEISALLQASSPGHGVSVAPGVVARAPWRPVWAVVLAGRATGTAGQPVLVVIDAASGKTEVIVRNSTHQAWFGALTDRDPAAANSCPGGSTALVPFGVLTRDEEAFTSGHPVPGTAQDRTSVDLILSTVRAVNRADPGLYGGCVQQDCSLPQLVWVSVETVRALPGKTVACLPGFVSVPPGYRPKHVKQYFVISVPNNLSVGCGTVPGPIMGLQNLAPPAK